MRNVFTAFIAAFTIVLGLLGIPQQAEASLTAGNAFASLKGNTTIDSGGVVHSQTRSIYSLGGGMTSFSGKRVTLLAADPPSFSAGCSGISWHFGGFSFISMDELRQLVEAVAQASLGIAVDLAMQTLCPQCYAVMSKLRDMANMMRNAAADACRVATNLGQMLANSIGLPDSKQTECSTGTSSSGRSEGFLNSIAGSLCRGMQSVNNYLDEQGKNILKFLEGDLGSGKTPPQEVLGKYFNVQYEMLSALGYQDGPVKDLLLNFMGMTIYYPEPVEDCSRAFKELRGDMAGSGSVGIAGGRSTKEIADTSDKTKSAAANTEATQTDKSLQVCHAPPRLTGVEAIGEKLVCGFNPASDIKKFAAKFKLNESDVAQSAIGAMCGLGGGGAISAYAGASAQANPSLYTCNSEGSARCLVPNEVKFENLIGGAQEGYTGLAWEIIDALYDGMINVKNDDPLSDSTKAILNGSGYPLYRLINLAAVYPGMAAELLNTYAATIAVQYAVDTLDRIARPGALSSLEVKGATPQFDQGELMAARANIANMFTEGEVYKDRTLKLMSSKRALIQSIVEINRALQSEVVSKGLSGNTGLAVSLKKQVEGD